MSTALCTVTCPHCGRDSSLDDMTRTPIGGDLPVGQYQCPHCSFAFQRREASPGQVWRAGKHRMYVPGRLALVPCEARL